MKLNRTASNWTGLERDKINENWGIIEGDYNDVVDNISEEAFNKVIEGSKIDWSQMVDTVNDLPSNPKEGETRGVKADNKIYRFNGSDWIPINEINLNPIAEVDQRLTSQLVDIDNLKNYELNSKGRQSKAFTVFRSDDGRIAEWDVAKDIFSEKGVPQCIAVISGRVGNSGYLSKEQLLTLQNDYGWEILSHSKTHPVRSQGQTMIPDLPEQEARHELYQSKKELEAMGLDVQSYAHVGGQYRTRDRKLTREYYRAAMVSDVGKYVGLNKLPIESHELKAIWVDPSTQPFPNWLDQYGKSTAIQMTKDRAFTAIDKAHNEGGIVVIGTHFTYINDDDYKQMYRDVIDYAKSKTKVTTLRDALNHVGNIVEVGDFSKDSVGDREGGGHFVVGADGSVDGGLNVAERDQYNNDSPWDTFPIGLTLCPISSNNSSGFPESSPGVLFNNKTRVAQFSLNYQEYRVVRSNRTYYRYINNDQTFSEWGLEQRVHYDNDKSPRNSPSSYFGGVTYSRISSAHQHIDDLPYSRPGVLVTHRDIVGEPWGSTYQEYHLNYDEGTPVFKRRALSSSDWTEWNPVGLVLPNDVDRLFSDGINQFHLGITYTPIGTSHKEITQAPEGRAGLLVTHKTTYSGNLGMNYQEYHLNFDNTRLSIYKRRPLTTSTWTDWVKVSVE